LPGIEKPETPVGLSRSLADACMLKKLTASHSPQPLMLFVLNKHLEDRKLYAGESNHGSGMGRYRLWYSNAYPGPRL